ncbi:LANO_0C00562g1_1 [Lachancea nothofagi CBS 11611]|uniref:LANO_0C00562g1_1 n=1 Tax=Lachancea nothofagi CBS 11611 TaxID=1266666 RepID=A0A1G4J339_9SACH|nr:LANO_0C00562g1_1 [Lachancea nothofagi CBS 11611]
MVKKVSKHSRASRRREAEDMEAQTLAQLPRAQNLDLTNKLIRTASKNEQLLEAKMKKKDKTGSKIAKKTTKKSVLDTLDSQGIERALNISSRLDGKVDKAKTRAKYVQAARKAGWDSTNESIRRDLAKLVGRDISASANKEKDDAEKEPTEEESDIMADEVHEEEPEVPSKPAQTNMFGLLTDDVEA